MPRITDEERIRATRQDTIRTRKQHNLQRKFLLSTTPFLSGLFDYMTTLEGGGKSERDARQRAGDVSRFLYYCHSDQAKAAFIRDKHKINEYISALKRHTTTAASTMKNILRSLQDGSMYLDHTDTQTSTNHKVLKKYLKKLKKSLNDNHRRRKQYCRMHRLQEDAAAPDIQDAASKLRDYEATVEDMIDHPSGLDNEERNTVSSYMVSRLSMENASRPGHITNLTQEEFNSSVRIGTDYVATCCYSKNGVAPVTFSSTLFNLTKRYIRNIRNTTPGASGGGASKVFVNTKANILTNVSGPKHLYKVLKLAGVNRKFTLTQLRKALTSRAVRQYGDSSSDLSLFHGYLAHSPEVANMYYRTVHSRNEYHRGYELVQGILNG